MLITAEPLHDRNCALGHVSLRQIKGVPVMNLNRIMLVLVVLVLAFGNTALAGPDCNRKPDHPSCGGGGGGGGAPAGNPSFVYSTRENHSVVRVMDADGSNDRAISKTAGSPHWGPDGNEIAWVDGKFNKWRGIVVARLDGSPHPVGDPCEGETLCILFEDTNSLEVRDLDWGDSACPVLNGLTGRYIAFIGHGDFHGTDFEDSDLFLINRDDAETLSAPVNMTNRPNEDLQGVAWSPDGQRIATYAHDEASRNGEIIIIDICNGYSRTEIQLPANHPVQRPHTLDWVQNGSEKLLAMNSDGIWIIDFTTSVTSPMISIIASENGPAVINQPISTVWSPNGNEIAVTNRKADLSMELITFDISAPASFQVIGGVKPWNVDWRTPDMP
jgi:WD40 repeat protein